MRQHASNRERNRAPQLDPCWFAAGACNSTLDQRMHLVELADYYGRTLGSSYLAWMAVIGGYFCCMLTS